jgi:hypothetical protein
MIHGKCKSAGCYAMTDALAEEIYALARESFRNGQIAFEVHAFPFRMTDEKLARFKGHKWYSFWATLKQGYDYFEVYRVPPPIAVCEKKYVVGLTPPTTTGRIDPAGRCPRFQKPIIEPFNPNLMDQQIAEQRIVVPGSKARDATALAWSDGAAPPAPAPVAAPTSPATGSIQGAPAPVVAPLTAGAATPRKPPQKSYAIPATLGLNQP